MHDIYQKNDYGKIFVMQVPKLINRRVVECMRNFNANEPICTAPVERRRHHAERVNLAILGYR